MNLDNLKIDDQAEYSIRVAGHLDESWSKRLGGMVIHQKETANQKSETTLQGALVDQAALLGVLNTLYNLRLPLISVELHSTA